MSWSLNNRMTDNATSCGCIGPQNGEPLCPCMMRNVEEKNGRYVKREQDLGPVLPNESELFELFQFLKSPNKIDEDGYRIIPKLPKDLPIVPGKSGIKCGECGMVFEDGKAYAYSCMNSRCPVFPQITC